MYVGKNGTTKSYGHVCIDMDKSPTANPPGKCAPAPIPPKTPLPPPPPGYGANTNQEENIYGSEDTYSEYMENGSEIDSRPTSTRDTNSTGPNKKVLLIPHFKDDLDDDLYGEIHANGRWAIRGRG